MQGHPIPLNHGAQERRATSRRNLDGLPPRCVGQIEEGTAAGVEAGLKAVFNDDEFCAKFWKQGHKIFVETSADEVHVWIGKRIMQTFLGAVIALIAAIVAWKVGFLKW